MKSPSWLLTSLTTSLLFLLILPGPSRPDSAQTFDLGFGSRVSALSTYTSQAAPAPQEKTETPTPGENAPTEFESPPPANYESDSASAESSESENFDESSTIRSPHVPAALRRSFAATAPAPSIDAPPVAPPKKKTKTRRRKVKRPRPSKKPSNPKGAAAIMNGAADDLAAAGNASSGTGEKILALEIGSDDGKYALINQFFPPKTESDSLGPGILSYSQSLDFPADNAGSLGNVPANDIWLSEGDLLVLKGGSFDSASREKWPPIDDYQRTAPGLRIPLDSNNPPPFPVFVNVSGPPVFLGPPPPFGFGPYSPGGPFNESFDPSRFPPPGLVPLFPNGSMPDYNNFFGNPPPNQPFPPFPFSPPKGGPIGPGLPGGVNGGVYGAGGPPGGGYGYGGGGQPPYSEFPPNNGSYPPIPPGYGNGPPGQGPYPPFLPPPPGFNTNFSGGPGPGGPFPPFLPPLVLNPADNETDDPSIFLPPPYDFDYPEEKTSVVAPGPFAPGLVVPPPQDFYVVYNRTSPRPILSFTYSTPRPSTPFKRPQRPNAKKPKFPITNPPDDSEEAAYPPPPPSSPIPVISISFPPKKRKRPHKNRPKVALAPLRDSSEEYSGENPTFPDIVKPRPLLATTSTTTEAPTTPTPTTPLTTTTTPRALVNYVYIRGQLKSLAEIAAEEAAEEGFPQNFQTPRPPYDELGYPTRNGGGVEPPVDIGANIQTAIPLVYQYSQRIPTQEPPIKQYFASTPAGNLNYNPNPQTYTKKSKAILRPTSYTYSSDGIEPYRTGVRISGKYPVVNYYKNDGYVDPSAHTPAQGQNNAHAQNANAAQNEDDSDESNLPVRYQQQQYKQQQPYTNTHAQQQQPYTPTHAQQNAGFRPAFPPPVQKEPARSSRVLFPGQISSRTPNIYNTRPTILYQRQPQQHQQQQNLYQQQQQQQQPILYQQQQQQLQRQQQPIQGYFSPISQYHQPAEPGANGQFIPSSFFGSQLIPNYEGNAAGGGQFLRLRPGTGQQQQQQQFFQPFQQLAGQQQQYSPFIQPQLQQDTLVNYREPLPQYNTESESIATRTVAKAGPRLHNGEPSGAGSSASSASASVQPGSFYSFHRGGPGGFSYKIRL